MENEGKYSTAGVRNRTAFPPEVKKTLCDCIRRVRRIDPAQVKR